MGNVSLASFTKTHPYISNTLLLIFSCLLTIIAFDLTAFFIFDIKVPGYGKERFIQKSTVLGWMTRPNAEGYWYRWSDGTKFYVETNGYGFSDSERDLQKTRPRIALIGDSTTQNWEAETANRGQYVIERLLGNAFEVLNFGVRGYGTDQTYILFENIGIHFSLPSLMLNFPKQALREPFFRSPYSSCIFQTVPA